MLFRQFCLFFKLKRSYVTDLYMKNLVSFLSRHHTSALASSTFLIATTLASLLFFTNREAVPSFISDASSSLPSRS